MVVVMIAIWVYGYPNKKGRSTIAGARKGRGTNAVFREITAPEPRRRSVTTLHDLADGRWKWMGWAMLRAHCDSIV